jgi:hypothetical protein
MIGTRLPTQCLVSIYFLLQAHVYLQQATCTWFAAALDRFTDPSLALFDAKFRRASFLTVLVSPSSLHHHTKEKGHIELLAFPIPAQSTRHHTQSYRPILSTNRQYTRILQL